MELTTTLLCDFAQVRDGMLFVSSGAVTRLWRDQMPAPMGVCLALVFEIDSVEMERPHEVEVYVIGEDGARHAEAKGGFQVGAELEANEKLQVPLVLDLREVRLPVHGPYDVKVYVDTHHQRTLTCRVAPREQAAP